MILDDMVRPLLAKRGWTKSELARRIGIAPGTLSSTLARDIARIRPRTLHRMARALGVSTDIFFSSQTSVNDQA